MVKNAMKGSKEMAETIGAAAGQLLEGTPVFVLDVRVAPGRNTRVKLVVDGDTGVTIDECARISRELNRQMEGLGFTGDYNLEVTTPGVDQPLQLPRQFPKHIGRTLKVVPREGKEMRGKLMEVLPEALRLELEPSKEVREVPMQAIEKTYVMISFK